MSRGKSVSTVTRAVASLKSFFGYLYREGYIDANPARGVAPAKVERKLPQILTSKEVELFLEQPECTDAKGYRDHAMLELLYATGIRVSELIDLDMEHLSLSAVSCAVWGKGKERIIPLYPAAVRPGRLSAGCTPSIGGKTRRRRPFCQYERQAYVPAGLLENHQALSGEGRNQKGDYASYAPPLLCGPSAGKWADLRSIQEMLGSADIFFHTDLCTTGQTEIKGRLHQGAPAGLRVGKTFSTDTGRAV